MTSRNAGCAPLPRELASSGPRRAGEAGAQLAVAECDLEHLGQLLGIRRVVEIKGRITPNFG